MNIGFEAKRLFTNFTGLGNYNRFVVDALATHFPEHHYSLFTPRVRSHPEIDTIISKPSVNVVLPSRGFQVFKSTSIWRSISMGNHKSSARQLNVFHGLNQEIPYGLPSHVKKVVTVHDLIFLRFPSFYSRIDAAIYKAKVKSACSRADKVVAISQQTADDLVEYLNVDREKIEVIYQGCHPIFKQIINDAQRDIVKKKYALPERYLLNVGTIEERKNILVAVKALAAIDEQQRIPLVVIGRETRYTETVKDWALKHGVLKSLHFIHKASFTDFPAIYQSAQAFIYPSLFEGFGIPLVEAIESGIPVITSTGSCFKEAAGPGAIYVDPLDFFTLSQNIVQLINDDHLRTRMMVAQRQHIKMFEPKEIAFNFIRLFKKLEE